MPTSQVAIKPGNIVEIALDEGSLSMLVQALQASGLAEELAEEGPFTLFAPTDNAFNQYTSKTINELMNDKDELITLLSYHIVPGKYTESDLKKVGSLQTLLGKELNIKSGSVINNARILQPDLECSNGVLQVIDSVLIPK